MPTPLNLDGALNALQTRAPLYAFDCEGAYDNFRWVWGEKVYRANAAGTPRKIKAVVLAMSYQDLQLYAEGNIQLGGLAILTKEQFFIADVNNAGVQMTQTFVEYQDKTWRIVGDGRTSGAGLLGNASFNSYHALRYEP